MTPEVEEIGHQQKALADKLVKIQAACPHKNLRLNIQDRTQASVACADCGKFNNVAGGAIGVEGLESGVYPRDVLKKLIRWVI